MRRGSLPVRRSLAAALTLLTAGCLTLSAGGDASAATTTAVPAVSGASLSALYYSGPRVYYTSKYGHIQELNSSNNWQDTDVVSANAAISAASGSALVANYTIDGPCVLYFSSDGHMQLLSSASGWQNDTDITAAAKAPAAMSGSPLTVLGIDKNSMPRAYYVTKAGHIEEIRYSGGWIATDLTATTGAALAGTGTKLTSLAYGTGLGNPRIYYTTADNHIQELAWGGSWSTTDMTAQTGAPAAESGASLTSFPRGDKELRVYYTTSDGHIQEISWAGGWHTTDVLALAGAEPAAPRAGLAWYKTSENNLRVDYTSADGHVRELDWDGGWSSTDITAVTGGATTVPGSQLAVTHTVTNGESRPRIYDLNVNGGVQELAWDGGWKATDISAP